MGSAADFLRTSPIARKIKPDGEVIVYREAMNGGRIAAALEDGVLVESDGGDSTAHMVVGGQTLATGRIVQKRGEWYFRVEEIGDPEEVR